MKQFKVVQTYLVTASSKEDAKKKVAKKANKDIVKRNIKISDLAMLTPNFATAEDVATTQKWLENFPHKKLDLYAQYDEGNMGASSTAILVIDNMYGVDFSDFEPVYLLLRKSVVSKLSKATIDTIQDVYLEDSEDTVFTKAFNMKAKKKPYTQEQFASDARKLFYTESDKKEVVNQLSDMSYRLHGEKIRFSSTEMLDLVEELGLDKKKVKIKLF